MPAGLKTKELAKPLVMVGGHVPRPLRDRFAAQARSMGLTVAGLIRQCVEHVAGDAPAPPPSGGSAQKLTLRLRNDARARLRVEAAAHGTTPTAWATAMLEAQLGGKVRWSKDQLTELRAARTLIAAIRDKASDQDAVIEVSRAMKLIDAAMAGNMAYWGITASSAAGTFQAGGQGAEPVSAAPSRDAGSRRR